MNMKTNVIFKNGLNLVCDSVNVYSHTTFMYIHNVNNSTKMELMNECLKNKWGCIEENNSIHPDAVRLSIDNNDIERFALVL